MGGARLPCTAWVQGAAHDGHPVTGATGSMWPFQRPRLLASHQHWSPAVPRLQDEAPSEVPGRMPWDKGLALPALWRRCARPPNLPWALQLPKEGGSAHVMGARAGNCVLRSPRHWLTRHPPLTGQNRSCQTPEWPQPPWHHPHPCCPAAQHRAPASLLAQYLRRHRCLPGPSGSALRTCFPW